MTNGLFSPFVKIRSWCKIPEGQAVEVILDIYLRPSKWLIFAFYIKFTDSW